MLQTILTSFLLIFLAEMGDKTQLIALSFAARFKLKTVIFAILAATILNNLFATTVGSLIFKLAPSQTIRIISYAIFIAFGLWTLFSSKNEDGKTKESRLLFNPFITVAVFFIISELGDKTQISAMLLAIDSAAFFPVFIGASAGMFAANLIGIAAGAALGKKFPLKTIKIISAAMFIIIGITGMVKTIAY
ncbi:MAG: TMEM165/GDT1 family protein [Elusimicrobiota bacterium]|jgi:putative Ca2+/H+ antiporter (TMEM165/GDT1 family)|nr:TMEM165/GDT1 family protein [Elusimicrobiota bacterium]